MRICRFEKEVKLFAEEMLKVLNNEKNRKKGKSNLTQLIAKYREERDEFQKEINAFDVSRAPDEAIDLANVLMMIWAEIKLKS